MNSSDTTFSPGFDSSQLVANDGWEGDPLSQMNYSMSSMPTLRYEAEDLELIGYDTVYNNASSGNNHIFLNKGNNILSGTATGVFDGGAGTYRVKVGYYDQASGVSSATVNVAGQSQSFLFEEDIPVASNISEAETSRFTHSIIGLKPGDVFQIEGHVNEFEKARFDYIEFIPVEATLQTETTLRYEAEEFEPLGNFGVESNNDASAGENISLVGSGQSSGTVAGIFDGETGIYQVKVGYFNDDVSTATVTVGGQSRSFQLDEDLGSAEPITESVTHLAVELQNGDSFQIEAQSNLNGPARFDYIEFVAVNPNVGSTYYVSPNGSDNNSGTQQQPWKTINHAVSRDSPVTAGDTILVQPGTYTELITLDKSGYEGIGLDHITLKANGNVILKDPDPINGDFKEGVIQSAGKSYWIIDGFRIENTSWAGISLRDANNMIVQNNHTFESGASGIIIMPDTYFWGGNNEVTSSDIKILGNTIERANWGWSGNGDTTGTQEALSIWGVDGFEVANNIVKEGTREGIDIKTGSRNGSVHNNIVTDVAQISGTYAGYRGGPAIYVDGNRANTFNIDVYNNLVYNNTADGIVIADEVPGKGDVRDIRVYNNVVYDNGILGVNGGVGIKVTSNVSDVEVINNTVVNNIQSIVIDGTDFTGGHKPFDILVRNNIFADPIFRNGLIEDANDLVLDNNLFTDDFSVLYEGGTGLTGFVETNNIQVATVGFLNSAANDYRLSSVSAAIDIGSDLIPDYASIDIDGIQRDKDGDGDGIAAPDVGAYEYTVA
ncbi:MAG: right-handed parallel beta-helix repeat-containing protein [Cyanobacteria bacterium P01_D01_bin.50]